MNASRVGLLVAWMLVAALARPAAGDDCREEELDAQGKCPKSRLLVKPTQLDIQGVDIRGAQVSLDGKVAGRAPLVVPTTPGRHRVEVKREGYAPYSAWIDVKQGERRLLQVKLQPVARATPACPEGMVRVPAATFRMGSPDKVGEAKEHPQHLVKLPTYCIDKTEVTVKAYRACVAANGCTLKDTTRFGDPFCNQQQDTRLDHPINCVDWDQAAAYCKWAGKRLPTEAEWEYAARGADGRSYPWGNQAPSAKLLNACGRECVMLMKQVTKVDWLPMYNTDDGWPTTAPVGSFPGDKGPFGVLDMAGNVQEWIADWYGDYSGAEATSPKGAETGKERVMRGGSWKWIIPDHVRAAVRRMNDPTLRTSALGFRCARGD